MAARLLAPAADIYGTLAARRMAQPPRDTSALPVLCIGNFTAGGTGKTPLAIWLAERLKVLGLAPAILTRGYGSPVRVPTLVDLHRHTAIDVGDEALLLARAAPVMVSPDRAAGARAIAAGEIRADVIVMDDGLQNPALAKDLTIAVVDGVRGFGNGYVIPSGPLRAPLRQQLAKTDVVVVNGRREDRDALAVELAGSFSGPILAAWPEPSTDISWLRGARVLAFAGIGNPDRFFRMLERLGATLVGERKFSDHHIFSQTEAVGLLSDAQQCDALLVTTEKDFVRLGAGQAQDALRHAVRAVPIAMVFGDGAEKVLMARVEDALARRRPV